MLEGSLTAIRNSQEKKRCLRVSGAKKEKEYQSGTANQEGLTGRARTQNDRRTPKKARP